ncbi:MAG: hypothetical protein ACREBW_05280 [Candidatus Micrarchaeaceae archaeon]
MPEVKGPADYLELGTWNIVCSMCGKKLKASDAVRNWQGMWRHPRCNEPRQPQDFVRGIPDIQTPAFVQKDNDQDITTPAFPDSGVVVENNTGITILIALYADGINLTEILVNDASVPISTTQITLANKGTVRLTYTDTGGFPVWAWLLPFNS